MYKNFSPLKRYLEERLNISIKIRVAKEPVDVIKHLEKGEADIAFICPTLYCEAYDRVSITPLVKLSVNGSTEERSALVVRDDSSVYKLADLFDKTFAYGRYKCPESGLLPEIMLKRVGIGDGDLLEVVRLGSDESALVAVLARMFDATAASEIAVRPYLDKGLRALRYSYPIPQYLFVARNSIGRGLILKLKEALLSLNHDRERKKILGGIKEGIDGFSETKDSDYDLVRQLMSVGESKEKGRRFKGRDEIRFVVEPTHFAPDLFIEINPLISYLERMTGKKFRLIIPEGIEEYMRMIKNGVGDIFFQNHYLYSEAIRTGSINGIASAITDTSSNVGVIITHTIGNIKKVNDLEGKNIGITSRYSDTGFISQRDLLVSKGVKLKEIKFIELKTYEDIIMKVYRGQVDAGFVSLHSLESMKDDIDMRRIVVLSETPQQPEWVLAVRAGMTPEFIDKIKISLFRYRGKGEDRIMSFKALE